MLNGTGKVSVNKNDKRIVVEVSHDFVQYYNWFLKKEKWIDLHEPKYKGHITIANFKLHPFVDYQLAAKMLHNKQVTFSYTPNPIQGGFTKGFVMFYLEVFSNDIDKIKQELNIIDSKSYRGLHITLGNLNKNGQQAKPYWPNTIEIR
jgi:hypothetical protein